MRRFTSALAMLTAFLVLAAVPSWAAEPISDTAVQDFFYEDRDAELVLLTGPTFEEGCIGEGFTEAPRLSWQAADGTFTSNFRARDIDAYLYEAPSFLDLIAVACGAVATGGEVPQPIATGTVSYDAWVWGQSEIVDGGAGQSGEPGTSYSNETWGTLVYADGTQASVSAAAQARFLADGSEDLRLMELRLRPV